MSDIDKFFQEFEPGDKVRVTRKAESHEKGWETIWIGDMDKCIGKSFEVKSVCTVFGCFLGEYWFPTFVLERVDE